MLQLGAPGVYIVEGQGGPRPITTVATSIAAFIDHFAEGPMDRAVEIFGMADFERIYGGIDAKSAASYAIQQFFLNGGSSALVVRVTNPLVNKGVANAPQPSTLADIEVLDGIAGSAVFKAFAANEGAWGNTLRLTITPTSGDTSPFNVVVSRYDNDKPRAKPIQTEKFLALTTTKTDARYYEAVINDGSQLVSITADGAATPTMFPCANGTLGTDLSAIAPAAIAGLTGLNVSVQITAPGGAQSGVRTSANLVGLTTSSALADVRSALQTALRKAATNNDPDYDAAFAGITVELTGTQLLIRSNRSAPTYQPDEIVDITAGTATLGTLGLATPVENVQEYWLGEAVGASAAKGAVDLAIDGGPPGPAELVGTRSAKTGMFALEDADLFNLLCIPRAAELTAAEMTVVMSNAISYCEERRAFVLIDIPESINGVQEVQDWLNANAGFRHPNSAVYFPRLEIPDPVNNFRNKSVGPSGTMAGLYSRTDAARGVWKAPAGIDATLRGVTALDAKLTDGQNGVLNPEGINCFRNFPIYGQVAWGARTLFGADVMASEWKYIPIRRLALMIEESLFRGTKWVVFEPNDEPLWAKIRLNVGAFMLQLFRQGAFQGTTPDKAFYVKCDGETTTANDRNLGIVNIEVGFAPLKPAEFVVITIQQIPDIATA
jgi:phage tail sheath protein FI